MLELGQIYSVTRIAINNIPQKIIFPKISIVMPCYNEEKTIPYVLDKINQLELKNYEVVVVDGGSKDNTLNVVKSYENIKLIAHAKKEGYGKAIMDGVKAATGDIIITMDSDGQHNPMDIPNLIQPILEDRADIVLGSRYKGKYNYEIPFINRAGEAFIEIMLKILFGKTVQNNLAGMRVLKRSAIEIFENCHFKDMAFTSEIVIKAILKDYRIVEAPIRLRNRINGTSRVRRVKMLFDLAYCLLYYIEKKYLHKTIIKDFK